jgi:hypothetical protein
MKKVDPFIKAYREFKDTVDFSRNGILPDENNMISYLLMGVPRVPADDVTSGPDASIEAIDQRIIILKAVFIELNHDANEMFLDEGFKIYDNAGEKAKILLKETSEEGSPE